IVVTAAADRIDELTQAQKENIGASQEMAELMASGLSGSVKTFRSTVEEAYLQLGDHGLGGAVQHFVESGSSAIRILVGFETEADRATMTTRVMVEATRLLATSLGAMVAIRTVSWLYSTSAALLAAANSTDKLSAAIARHKFG